jgi:hypothetical protein
VASGTEATARANRFLDEFDHEQTTYYCWLDLPASKVDTISWGQTISFRSAACAILTPTTFRISKLAWEWRGLDQWRAHLELNFPTKFGRRSGGGGSGAPGGTNPPPTTAPPPFVPGTPVPADSASLAVGSVAFGYPAPPDGEHDFHTEHAGSLIPLENGAEYRLVWDQTTNFFAGGGYGYNFLSSASISVQLGAEGGLPASSWVGGNPYPLALAGPWTPGSHFEGPWKEWSGTDGTLVDLELAGVALSGYYGAELGGTLKLEKRGGASGGTTEEDPVGFPSLGQPVYDQVGSDGTADPGSPTPYPYAPNSLIIFVNGVNLTSDLTELDPAAGTYEFADPIPEGAIIERWYQGTGETL